MHSTASSGQSSALSEARRFVGRVRRRVAREVAQRGGLAGVRRGGLPSLNDIGIETGTDKASTIHDYLGVYEQAVGHLRHEQMQVLEIGVHKAASLRMWEKYFHNARIIGVDLKKDCRKFAGGRVTIEIGDQGDEAFVQLLGKRYRPMVLIDDGSHRWEHQILSFRTLWPAVRPGGFFIMEDIHTSFGDDYRPVYGREGAESAYDYIAGIVEGVVARTRAAAPRDEFESYCRQTIESAQFLGHSIIIRKKAFPQPWFKRTSIADLPEAEATRFAVDAGSYDRIPAEIVNAGPKVAAAFERLSSSGTITYPPATSAVFEDVTVHRWGPTTTASGAILGETLNGVQNLRLSSQLYRPWGRDHWVAVETDEPRHHPVPADGRTPVLVRQSWDRNYGHWLIDAFGRIAAIRDHVDLSTCQFLVNHQAHEDMRQVVLDSFGLLGIGADQVTFCPIALDHYERLLVPGTVATTPQTKSPIVIRFLEDLGAQVDPAGDDRIYLSRAKSSRRRLLNAADVAAAVEARGYRVVHPEDLSLREQIAAMRGATKVVGDMGAGLANLAFSPIGVSVLALATEAMEHDYFYDIVCHKKGRYRGLQGRSTRAEGTPTLADDFEVDLGLLGESLDWLERS